MFRNLYSAQAPLDSERIGTKYDTKNKESCQ
jgi:hypothetical protein